MKSKITLSFLVLFFEGIIFIAPRILKYPEPLSLERFQLHQGDGFTEDEFVITAYRHWMKYGYLDNAMLACAGSNADSCGPYTHYSPLPQLVTSVLLQSFRAEQHFRPSLQATRWTIYGMNCLLVAWALTLMVSALGLDNIWLFLGSLYIAQTRGFLLYADHLLLRGTSFALMGLYLGFVLYLSIQKRPEDWRKIEKWLLGIAIFGFFLDWETVPAFFLSPLILVVLPDSQDKGYRPIVRLEIMLGVMVLVCLSLRLAQNALALHGFSLAVKDLVAAGVTRSIDIDITAGGQSHIAFTFSPKGLISYANTIVREQIYMMMSIGAAVIVTNMYFKVIRKEWKRLIIWAYLSFCAVSWNFVMFQHSIIHVFTTRTAAWAAVLALFELSNEFRISMRPHEL